MATPLIQVNKLKMTFKTDRGTVEAIKRIDLNVYEREFLCIVGPSGCGKSTLLFLIAGLLKKTEGSILVRGNEIVGPGPDRTVGFQKDAVFPWMSVYDNIAFGLKAKKYEKASIEKQVSKYISLIGLQGFEHAYPRELSGGMRKRVDLARCFAISPDVLLMDEPFGALDVFTKEHLQLEILRIWNEEKATIIFVTHDLEEALFLSSRIIVLSSRPSTIVKTIDNPFAYPRRFSLRQREDFQKTRTELWSLFEKI
jgi:NitT/TauT family transport system ATP-binding protein